jgi:hypothetical protein
MTFNETEIAVSINIRNFLKKTIIFITSTEITGIIEGIADINDANITLENIENTPFENVIIEPAPVRKSIRHRKATFKAVKTNAIAANTVGIAETSIISANKKESEKEDYLSKIIIAKLFIANEDKLTYEKAMADLKKF